MSKPNNLFYTVKNIFSNRTSLVIFALAIISGLPYGMLYTLIAAWLKESGVSLALIGSFALAKAPYSFKYIWAPIIDHLKLPIIGNLGRRKSWMLLTNISIICLVSSLAAISPEGNIKFVFAICLCIGFFAATYDIAFDAFRIESFSENMQATGSAIAVLGYRLGMIASSTIGLVVAGYSWQVCFMYQALLFGTGTLIIIIAKEDKIWPSLPKNLNFYNTIYYAVITPFNDFLTRRHAPFIIAAIVLYKFGEAMLSSMALPFYLDTGFSKEQIAVISKFFGLFATILGSFIGGIVMIRVGALKALFYCGILQMLSNLMFVWQNYIGNDPQALIITIAVENITGGMASSALIGYLSSLCNKNYAATQYSLLSAMATLTNNTFTSSSGILAEKLGWNSFFILTVILCIPALILIFFLIMMEKRASTKIIAGSK